MLKKSGFTLIELSIVLVIIGLLVGGVLVGKDLIAAAEIRSQISQIEKYNTAVNTFKLKYGYLPGDIPDPTASAFGFAARGSADGQGDGNGILQGFCCGGYKLGHVQSGEPQQFWVDLSVAGLIDGNFSTATPAGYVAATTTDLAIISQYYPKAKIEGGLFVYVLNADNNWAASSNYRYKNNNFFSISRVTEMHNYSDSNVQNYGTTGIAVNAAYNIDSKVDDGLPISGNVTTISSITGNMYFSNADADAANSTTMPSGSAIPASSTTCYDNNNNSANPVTYSLSQNGGNGLNCALSFKFQ